MLSMPLDYCLTSKHAPQQSLLCCSTLLLSRSPPKIYNETFYILNCTNSAYQLLTLDTNEDGICLAGGKEMVEASALTCAVSSAMA